MKIRNGFVSNSSSSSFVATLTKNRFDSIEFTAPELAVIENACTEAEFEDIIIVDASFMMGNCDDKEDIDMETFAKSVISYSEKMSDPMLKEYQSEFVGAEMTSEEKVFAKIKTKGPSYCWDYFDEIFDEARYSIIKKFEKLEENKMCVIKRRDF